MAKGIRSYGPGKFVSVIDSYVYEMTLDGGPDEEIGDANESGWYGLVRVDDATRDRIRKIAKEHDDDLTPTEEALLDETVAIIITEGSNGSVDSDWYDETNNFEEAWTAITEDLEGDEDVEGDDGEEDAFSDEEMVSGYVISDSRRGGYDVAHEHKHVGHYEDMDEALDAIEAEMKRSNFFPNVYYVNDHGNVDLLDSDGNVIESRV